MILKKIKKSIIVLLLLTVLAVPGVVNAERAYPNGKGSYMYPSTGTVTTIENVAVTITEPVYGGKVDRSPNLGTDKLKVNYLYWFDKNGSSYTKDTFEEGRYNLRIFLLSTDNSKYQISENLKATINGENATTYTKSGVYYVQKEFFIEKTATEIKEVKLNVSNIELGKKVSDCKVTVPADAPYTAELEMYENTPTSVPRLENDHVFVSGKKYRVLVNLFAKDGYAFAKDLKGTINDIAETRYSQIDGKYRMVVDIVLPEVEEVEEIKEVKVKVSNLETGKKASDCKLTIPSGAPYTAEMEIAIKDGVKATLKMDPNDEFEAEKSYRVTVELYAKDGYAFAKDLKGTINDIAETRYSQIDGKYRMVVDIVLPEVEEVEEIKEVKVKVSNLETGKKASDCKLTIPSGAPYTAEMEIDIKDDVKATLKMMDPNDEFEAEKSYRVTVELYAKDGYTFAKDLKGTINGIKETKYVTMSNKNRIYVDVVMPEIEESEEYTWSKASEWAEPELKEASKQNLIPEIFDEANLTKNITRKEFAHTVVKMYEKITGQKAVPIAKNPFTDTKDKEVLKAYNIGITNGTSDTTFSPDALITREQMATMMTRALTKAGKDTSRPESAKLFADDSEFSEYAKDSIYYMSSIEIIKGVGDNKFDSQGKASREQALAISIRCVKKVNK